MRENYRKAIFIALLLTVLAVMVFFTAIEDAQKPTNVTNTDTEIEQNDEETSVIVSHYTFPSLLSTNASFSTMLDFLKKHDFVGRWQQTPSSQKPFDFFESNSGKVRLSISTYRNVSRKYEFFLYDGDYIDKKFLWLRIFEVTGAESNQMNSSEISFENLTAMGYLQNRYEIVNRKEFMNISLKIGINLEKLRKMKEGDKYTDLLRLDFDLSPRNSGNISIDFHANLRIDESLYPKTVRYAIMVGGVAIIHSIACFMMIQRILQSEVEGNSYSLVSLSFIAIWDMYLCIVNFLLAVKVEAYFHFLVTPAFCYFALFTVFETRLLMIIWKARYFPGQSNIEILRNSLFKFYMKFYFFLTIILIMANNLITSNIFLFAINLYFIPQIVHSTLKGQLIKPDKIFLYGLMLPRSFLVLYLKGCPFSLFEMTPSFFFVFCTLFVLALQLIIIYIQEYYGPRFFLPKRFFPNSYDYFLNLPDTDLEMCTESAEDCVICLNPLHQNPNINVESQSLANNQHPYFQRLVVQRKIMQTPCQHKFHSVCLLQWMTIKMECPTCRNPLPPL